MPWLLASVLKDFTMFATRAVFSKVVKNTTGLVGLDPVPEARRVLVQLYEKTLNDVKIMPEGVPYRKAVEDITNYRLNVVRKFEDIRDIEAEVGAGQVEELIEQAKDELRLIPDYAEWKEWEAPPLEPMVDQFHDVMDVDEFARAGVDNN